MIFIDIKKKLYTSEGEILLNAKINIKKGEFVSIRGKSGSGKTTLLRIIAGLEKSEGEIKVFDEIWQDKKTFLPPQKRSVGFVFQDYALFPNMNVLENLLYVNNDKNFALELLEMVGLINLKDRYPHTLSGGQKQRIALIRAIIKKPKILLLDEPFSALDSKMREKLQNDLKLIHKKFNLTTIMVSHLPSEIYKLSDKVIHIENGNIVNISSPLNELLNTKSSEKFTIEGEIIDIINADILNVAIIDIGNKLVEVVISDYEKDNLKVGERVIVSAKAFNLNISKG